MCCYSPKSQFLALAGLVLGVARRVIPGEQSKELKKQGARARRSTANSGAKASATSRNERFRAWPVALALMIEGMHAATAVGAPSLGDLPSTYVPSGADQRPPAGNLAAAPNTAFPTQTPTIAISGAGPAPAGAASAGVAAPNQQPPGGWVPPGGWYAPAGWSGPAGGVTQASGVAPVGGVATGQSPAAAAGHATPLPAVSQVSPGSATRAMLQELLPPPSRPSANTGAPADPLDEMRPLSATRIMVAPPPGEMPYDYARERIGLEASVEGGSVEDRRSLQMTYAWEASALSFGPLYIDNPNLERYGYSHGVLEPAFSTFHFFSHVVALPYLVATYPPNHEIYTLGYYRPGSYTPYRRRRPPLTLRGVLAEGALVCTFLLGIPGLP